MNKLFLFSLFFLNTIALSAQGYRIGSFAETFTLKNSANDQMTALSSIPAEKGYVVVFQCITCPFGEDYEERILSVQSKYSSKGFSLILVNSNDAKRSPDDDFNSMKKYATDKKIAYFLYDENQQVAKTFGASKTPQAYILMKEEGKLRVAYIGAIDDNTDPTKITKRYLYDALDALAAGKIPMVFEAPASGCNIKFGDK